MSMRWLDSGFHFDLAVLAVIVIIMMVNYKKIWGRV